MKARLIVLLTVVSIVTLFVVPTVMAAPQSATVAAPQSEAHFAQDAPDAPEPAFDIVELLRTLWTAGQLSFIAAHIVINVVIAVLAVVRSSDDSFALQKLGEFLYRKMLPYLGSYVAAYLLGDGANLAWLAPAIFVVIEATLAADLIDNLGKIGVPIPEAVKNFVTTDKR